MNELEAFAQFLALRAGVEWEREFERYDWDGPWQVGVDIRFYHHELLAAALRPGAEHQLFVQAAEQIRQWGGIDAPIQNHHLNAFRASSEFLQARPGEVQLDDPGIAGDRIATSSKIYGAVDPRTWTIYDSRVGASLQHLVRQHLVLPVDVAPSPVLQFRMPPARGLPPAPDPTVGPVNYHGHGRNGFLRASHVFRRVAAILNDAMPLPAHLHRVDTTWRVYHVEMALFMWGQA